MPKIFVSTSPFGEIDSSPLKLLRETGWEFEVNPYDRKLTPEEVGEMAADCDGLIAGTENINVVMEKAKKLKIVSRVGIGLDSVPLKKCRDRGITVTYTPDAVTMAVAELTVGIMISLTRHVIYADMEIRRSNWKRKQGKRIGNSTIGIIGVGRIGTETIKLLSSFKPEKILVNDIRDISDTIKHLQESTQISIKCASKKEIYRSADIVSLHVPFSPKTKNMINREILKQFRSDSYLINLARGGIVNETDLYYCLKEHQIAGAAIDCFTQEPYSGPLAELDNIILTQHMGSCSFDCRAKMEVQATEDMIRFFNKEELINEVPDEEFEYQLE